MLEPPDTEQPESDHAPDPADTTQPSTPSPPSSSLTPIPSTPERSSIMPSSPPPRRRNMHVVDRLPSPLADPPGRRADRMQCADLLCEMEAAVPRRLSRTPVPNPRYCGPDNAAQHGRSRRLGFAELLAAALVGRDPATYAEAMHSADADAWMEACQYEIDTLAKNEAWDLVDLPAGHKAVKSKWVFKLKSDGHFRA
jgi:hypothetical protein